MPLQVVIDANIESSNLDHDQFYANGGSQCAAAFCRPATQGLLACEAISDLPSRAHDPPNHLTLFHDGTAMQAQNQGQQQVPRRE
jgi:hypothetical protein